MDDRLYYGVTVALYLVCMAFAMSVDNLLVLFDYLSALSVSGIQFFMPGVCYVVLARSQPQGCGKLRKLSYSYIVLSFIVSGTILYTL